MATFLATSLEVMNGLYFLKYGVFIIELLKILQDEIEKSIREKNPSRLKIDIQMHNQIIGCSENLNDYFSKLLFIRYLLTAMTICMIGFDILYV